MSKDESDYPLVSIIIPMYNNAQYIQDCMLSIVTDDYPNKEVLIIDDGSKDNSYEVTKEWYGKNKPAFARFVLRKRENKGICATLNELVKMSNGEYITILASDDCLLKGGIRERVSKLQVERGLLAVFGDCIVINERNELLSDSGICAFPYHNNSANKYALKDKNLIALELILRWSIPGPVLMMRRDTFDVIGYYDETLIVEDRDYYLRLIMNKAIAFLDYKVACYRWHSNNMTSCSENAELRNKSASTAAMKSAKHAQGLTRVALLLDSKRRAYYYWRKDNGRHRVVGAIWAKWYNVLWYLLICVQDLRITLRKQFISLKIVKGI